MPPSSRDFAEAARRPYADLPSVEEAQLLDIGLPVGLPLAIQAIPLKERIFMLKKTLPSRSRRVAGIALAVMLVTAGAAARLGRAAEKLRYGD